jgi:excisionase family DNA binding protein
LGETPPLAEVVTDPRLVERLPLSALVEYRRQTAHLVADLDAAILGQVAQGTEPSHAGHGLVLTIEEAAARLRTSEDTLYRKRRSLRLGYRDPLDGRIKFTLHEVDEYIRRQRRA